MDRIPPIDEIKKSIKILQGEKWPSFEEFNSLDEFMTYFYRKFTEHFNRRMLYLSTPTPNPELKFYRVRAREEIHDVSSVREYSYPPSNYCKKNRANLPGHPVFYCSLNPLIALLETIRNNELDVDKEYCLTMWTLKEREKPFIFTPFIYHVENEDYQHLSGNILTSKLKESLKDSPYAEESESVRLILEYLSSSFVADDEKNYTISSFIGHSHLYMPFHARTDLFIYPSIQSSKKAVNIAINPNTVDESLMMKYLLILNVTKLDIESSNIEFATSRFGIVEGHKIVIKPSGNLTTGADPVYLEILKEFTGTV
jgi:hypothetical protein